MIRLSAILGTAVIALAAMLVASLTRGLGWFWPAVVAVMTAYAVWYFILTESDDEEPPTGEGDELEVIKADPQTARKRAKKPMPRPGDFTF